MTELLPNTFGVFPAVFRCVLLEQHGLQARSQLEPYARCAGGVESRESSKYLRLLNRGGGRGRSRTRENTFKLR